MFQLKPIHFYNYIYFLTLRLYLYQQPPRIPRIPKPIPIPVASPAEKSLTGTEISSNSSNKNASFATIVTFFYKILFVTDYKKYFTILSGVCQAICYYFFTDNKTNILIIPTLSTLK